MLSTRRSTTMSHPNSAPLPWSSGRLLIVDDDDDTRELMQHALERKGYEVVAVESGAEALGFIAHDTPSLILLDLEMNDMNGWEVLGALERHPRFDSFRVVVVSGSNGKVPSWAGYLRKPFRVDALLELLERDVGSQVSRSG